MKDQSTKKAIGSFAHPPGEWKGIIFNICFTLYYFFTYQLVSQESHTVNTYGLSSPLLFSNWLAWIVMFSLIAEPFAILYKLRYDQYNGANTLKFPGFYLVLIFASRFFIRLVFFIAALESAGIIVENAGSGAGLVATFVFITELLFIFAITDNQFIGKTVPTLRKEIATRFILLNMLVLFTYLFKIMFLDLITGGDQTITRKLFIGLLLFMGVYLPNTMVQFYGDWKAARTPVQKILYLLSLILAFISIILS